MSDDKQLILPLSGLAFSEKPEDKYVIVSVDVESTSTSPENGDLLSIGAAALWMSEPDVTDEFYVNIVPLTGQQDADTMEWWKQFPERFKETQEQQVYYMNAMHMFDRWLKQLGGQPIFMAWPAHFDFGWIDKYFFRAGLKNPFSYKPLDQASFIAGLLQDPTAVMGSRSRGTLDVPPSWEGENEKEHHALYDARAQRNGFVATLRDRGILL